MREFEARAEAYLNFSENFFQTFGIYPRITGSLFLPFPQDMPLESSIRDGFIKELHKYERVMILGVREVKYRSILFWKPPVNGLNLLIQCPCKIYKETVDVYLGKDEKDEDKYEKKEIEIKRCLQGDVKDALTPDAIKYETIFRIQEFNQVHKKDRLKILFITLFDTRWGAVGSRYFDEHDEFDKVTDDLLKLGEFHEPAEMIE